MASFNGTIFADNFVGANNTVNDFNFQLGELTSVDIVTGGTAGDHLNLVGPQGIAAASFTNVTGIEQLILDDFDTSVVLRNSLVTSSNYWSLYAFIVHCGTGDNTIDASGVTSTLPIWLDGSDGDDTFYGGNGDGSQLSGGEGTNVYFMGTGTEEAIGGNGIDIFQGNAAELAGDVLKGSSGTDSLTLSGAGGYTFSILNIDNIYLAAGVNNVAIESLQGAEGFIGNIYGSTGNDTITINTIDDAFLNNYSESYDIRGGAGDDVITGGLGDDTLRGEGNNDILNGGNGNDILLGGAGTNILSGGNGNDLYDNVSATDTIIEILTDGIDTIRTALSTYTMAYNVEILDYTGSVAVNFTGSATDNTIEGSGLSDIMNGRDGNDTLNGLNGDDTLNGEDGNDTLNGAGGLDTLNGNEGNDTLNGDGGVDTLNGNDGDDTLNGGIGDDFLYGNIGIDTLNGGDNADELHGGDQNDTLNGGAGVDTLFGGANDDLLRGDVGADVLDGGIGVDTADYGTAAGSVTFDLRPDIDIVIAPNGTDTVVDVETYLGSSYNDSFFGDSENNTIYGGAGFDTADYSTDTHGLHFNYNASQSVDVPSRISVTSLPGYLPGQSIGADGLYQFEDVIGGSGDDLFRGINGAHGGEGDDDFVGNALANIYYGDGGIDTVEYGDLGVNFDYLYVDLLNPLSNTEMAQGDTLNGIENLTYTSVTSSQLSGDDGNNVITSANALSYDNILSGRGGDDTFVSFGRADFIYGDSGLDTVDYSGSTASVQVSLVIGANGAGGTAERDHYASIEGIIGSAFSDTLTGGTDNDTLNGGVDTVADTLSGGLGNDTYVVNSANDIITELVGQGSADRVKASLAFALGAGDEIEILETSSAAATTAINLTGNELAQNIYGNNGTNTLNGGVDTLSDTLIGYGGNDIYVINSANDLIVEAVGGGTTDRLQTSVSFTLAGDDDIELMQTTNAAHTTTLNLTGNALAQAIYGNAGINTLNGGVDALLDTLIGYGGNDMYVINSALDIIVEAAGGGTDDRVQATVSFTLAVDDDIELMQTTNAAYATAINLTGNTLGQALYGNAGVNILNGGVDAARDTLIGYGGNDTYVINSTADLIVEAVSGGTADRAQTSVTFTLAADDDIEIFETTNAAGISALNLTGNAVNQSVTGNAGANTLNGGLGNDTLTGLGGSDNFLFNTALNATTNHDTIIDFNVAADTIQLENAIFTLLAATGALAANLFEGVSIAGQSGLEVIIYDRANGDLYYDTNGAGTAGGLVLFADVANNTVLTSADFFVV